MHTQSELVRKILISLPTSWIHKVTVIEESKDLERYDLEELIGSLMTHEIHIQSLQNKDAFRKKSLALKAVEENPKDEESSRSSCEESSDEDELVMLSKRIQKIMKMRKNGKKPTRNNKKHVYYSCGKIGHYKADCFKKKNDDRDKNKEKEAVKGKKKKCFNKK